MQRHGGDEHVGRGVVQQPRHLPRHHPREARPSAIFEPQRDGARNLAVGDGGLRPVIGGRIGMAGAADRALADVVRQGQRADGACRRPEEIERLPAGRAEAMIAVDDQPAARAPRRQREIDAGRPAEAQQAGDGGGHVPLSAAAPRCTSPAMSTAPPEPFDRARRRVRRDRAIARFAEHGFLARHIADELLARLDMVERDFANALVLGAADGRIAAALRGQGIHVVSADASFAAAHAAGGIQCDEDRLPFADGAFDLIVSASVLDSVSDLPGALLLARRALKPDGLFIAGFVGAGSLPRLRAAMLEADLAGTRGVAPRIHPQVDVRSAGDLLARAGFALPVADGETLDVRYRGLDGLLADLRFGGLGGVLAGTPSPLTTLQAAAAYSAFAAQADPDGRITESFALVYLIGWTPDASQPKPARRGSATMSLAAALKPKP